MEEVCLKNRYTELRNDILIDLLNNYSIEEIRCLFVCINAIRIKNLYLEREDNGYFNNIQYKDCDEWEDENSEYEVNIPLSRFKDYAIRKKRSGNEIVDIIKKINSKEVCTRINDHQIKFESIIDYIVYDEQFKEFVICFKKTNFDYIMDLERNFFSVNLKVLSSLKGKFETGIYLLYCRWISTGKIIMGMDQVKKFFYIDNINISNSKILQNIRNSIERVNKKLNSDIKLKVDNCKRGRQPMTNIYINFTPISKQCNEYIESSNNGIREFS